MSKNTIIKGTFILTITGFLTRFIGFFFRMFLSHSFGEEQVGLYQLIFPIYALCFSFTSAGIQTALARCVAQKVSTGNKEDADSLLYRALAISLALSLFLGYVVRKYAFGLSIYILGDLRCASLLQTLSFAFPFASVHSCICGYYLGLKQTEPTAISQFIEQIARVIVVYMIYKVCIGNHREISIQIAVTGLVAGEVFSSLYCLRSFITKPRRRLTISSLSNGNGLTRELFSLSLPLTSSRVLMNLLQSIETISIPLCLQRFGHSNSEALITYGVLTGMALPCILFPTALTNSVSTILLPTVAEFQAQGKQKRLKQLIGKALLFGLGLGSVCGIVFLLFGGFAGSALFDSSLAGDFMQTLAWICPFLYTNTTLISILNGLGKANQSFLINICGLGIRILGVWVGIVSFGMQGYLWGLLFSQLLVSIFCILELYLYFKKREP